MTATSTDETAAPGALKDHIEELAAALQALAKAEGRAADRDAALRFFETYLHHSFTPGVMPPKSEPTRPAKGVCHRTSTNPFVRPFLNGCV